MACKAPPACPELPLPLVPASKANILFVLETADPFLARDLLRPGTHGPSVLMTGSFGSAGPLLKGYFTRDAWLHIEPKANLLSSSLVGPIIFI